MARYRVDTLSQVARNGYWVAVICRFGNRRTFDPVALSLQYKVRMMDEIMKRIDLVLVFGAVPLAVGLDDGLCG